MINSQIDSSIPVLTEIIYPETDDAKLLLASETMSDADQEKWQQLEQTLRENVLRQVLSRIDFVLEHRVRDSLADVLQTAVESLATEIRGGLHSTLEDVITRAITQEIAKVKSLK